MSRRVLCFLTAAVLCLLPFCPALAACEHYTNGIVSGSDLVLRGYVAPQVGVPGYSGDFCCPMCGAIAIRGQTLPALEPPNDHEGKTDQPQDNQDTQILPAATKPSKTAAPTATRKPSATKKPSGTKQNGPKATDPPAAPERTVFSAAYPYRRVRMAPEEGIRAEFAGERVWRGALSPFQSLFGD